MDDELESIYSNYDFSLPEDFNLDVGSLGANPDFGLNFDWESISNFMADPQLFAAFAELNPDEAAVLKDMMGGDYGIAPVGGGSPVDAASGDYDPNDQSAAETARLLQQAKATPEGDEKGIKSGVPIGDPNDPTGIKKLTSGSEDKSLLDKGKDLIKNLTGLDDKTINDLAKYGLLAGIAKLAYDDAEKARQAAKGWIAPGGAAKRSIVGPKGHIGYTKAAQGGVMSLAGGGQVTSTRTAATPYEIWDKNTNTFSYTDAAGYERWQQGLPLEPYNPVPGSPRYMGAPEKQPGDYDIGASSFDDTLALPLIHHLQTPINQFENEAVTQSFGGVGGEQDLDLEEFLKPMGPGAYEQNFNSILNNPDYTPIVNEFINQARMSRPGQKDLEDFYFKAPAEIRNKIADIIENKQFEMYDSGYASGGVASLNQRQPFYLGGSTDGMTDEVPAHIDGKRPAALSDGEFVIPADVVSHLGNGNSNAGAQRLYEMMDQVRQARTGTTKQGKQINPEDFTKGVASFAGGGEVMDFRKLTPQQAAMAYGEFVRTGDDPYGLALDMMSGGTEASSLVNADLNQLVNKNKQLRAADPIGYDVGNIVSNIVHKDFNKSQGTSSSSLPAYQQLQSYQKGMGLTDQQMINAMSKSPLRRGSTYLQNLNLLLGPYGYAAGGVASLADGGTVADQYGRKLTRANYEGKVDRQGIPDDDDDPFNYNPNAFKYITQNNELFLNPARNVIDESVRANLFAQDPTGERGLIEKAYAAMPRDQLGNVIDQLQAKDDWKVNQAGMGTAHESPWMLDNRMMAVGIKDDIIGKPSVLLYNPGGTSTYVDPAPRGSYQFSYLSGDPEIDFQQALNLTPFEQYAMLNKIGPYSSDQTGRQAFGGLMTDAEEMAVYKGLKNLSGPLPKLPYQELERGYFNPMELNPVDPYAKKRANPEIRKPYEFQQKYLNLDPVDNLLPLYLSSNPLKP